MAKTEDGEYELVLGNSQLLGVFFVVVVLMAVLFALGYVVGTRSVAAVAAEGGVRQPVASNPVTVDAPAPRAKETAPAVTEDRPTTTQPQTADAEPAPKSAPPAASSVSQPAPGTYLQLSATKKNDAETYVDVLKKKGFLSITVPTPDDPNRFRVLVGPIKDGDLGKTRADLEKAGVPGDKAIKRNF